MPPHQSLETFETQIAANRRRSWWLLGLLPLVLFMAIASGLLLARDDFSPDAYHTIIVTSGYWCLGISALAAALSYWGGPAILSAYHGAITIHYADDPLLYNVVEEVCIAAGIPMPSLFAVIDDSPNAFSTGRSPAHARLFVTTGLRRQLTRQQLQAVVAHEVAHIKNLDTRVTMLAAVYVGAIVLVTDLLLRHCIDVWRMRLFWGRSKSSFFAPIKTGLIAVKLLLLALMATALLCVSPVFGKLLQLCLSREREYLADATAIQFCRDPDSLIEALKITGLSTIPYGRVSGATNHLYFVNPELESRVESPHLDSIWMTHPPLLRRIQRIARLQT